MQNLFLRTGREVLTPALRQAYRPWFLNHETHRVVDRTRDTLAKLRLAHERLEELGSQVNRKHLAEVSHLKLECQSLFLERVDRLMYYTILDDL